LSSETNSGPDLNSVIFVSEKRELKQFIEFPYKHYKDDKHWIAPLILQQKELLDFEKNPFFKDAEVALFLAEFNGRLAGRIAAIHNKGYNRFTNSNSGFFGFFECIDNQSVANLLFKVAGDWLTEKGITEIYGPMSPNMMAEMGILVEGFEYYPAFLMPYNKPYYESLIKNAGYDKHIDLLAYRITSESVQLDRAMRAEEIVRRRLPNLKIREVNLRKFKSEIVIIHDIFNKAWARNWGFAPLTVDEFEYLVKDMKFMIDTDFAHVAEIDGMPVAFSISLPDINVILKKMDGRLLPTGIFKLLYYKGKIRQVRSALMGVIPEWQGYGIDAVIHQQGIINGLKRGFKNSEMSWLLETNTSMINVAERMGAVLEKRYRIYKKQ